MNISFTPDQEHFIQTKLQAGKYRSAEEILEMALRLLDEYDRTDAEWVNEVRTKIDAAIKASTHTPPIDGETFVNQILECQQLVAFPNSGKSYGTIHPDLRGLFLEGYVIFYRILDDGIEILRVVSGRRNFPALFEESN
jgi:antitoxin ParD1/3/4